MTTTLVIVGLVVLVVGYLVYDWSRDRRLARTLSSGSGPRPGRPREHHRDVHASQAVPRSDTPRLGGSGG